MDKQQAITYIHQSLDLDATREEIVSVLVEQLHAPEAMVSKFVAQTEAEYLKNKPQPLPPATTPQPSKLPPWLDEMTIGSQSTQNNNPPVEPQPDWMQQLAQSASLVGSPTTASDTEPIPDWVQPASPTEASYLTAPTADTPARDDEVDKKKITNTTEAGEFVITEYGRGRPKMEIAAELATRTNEPLHLTEKFTILTIAKAEKSREQIKPKSSSDKSPIDMHNKVLVNYVVAELTKHRKRSDIAMAICERTGVHWSEAQRFVGQVSVEQHTTINARKNRMIIPMCIGAIVLGFIFTIGTAIPMFYLVSGRWTEFYSLVGSMGNLGDYINAAPYIFGTGIVLISGGIIGMVFAIQSQME